jgi:hypothetical protein
MTAPETALRLDPRIKQHNSIELGLASHSCCTFHYIFVCCRSPGSASYVSANHFSLNSVNTIFISFAPAVTTDSPSRSSPWSQLLMVAWSLEADEVRVI